MMLYGGGYTPPISYLFIDGDNLRRTMARISAEYLEGEEPPISWHQMRAPYRKVSTTMPSP